MYLWISGIGSLIHRVPPTLLSRRLAGATWKPENGSPGLFTNFSGKFRAQKVRCFPTTKKQKGQESGTLDGFVAERSLQEASGHVAKIRKSS